MYDTLCGNDGGKTMTTATLAIDVRKNIDSLTEKTEALLKRGIVKVRVTFYDGSTRDMRIFKSMQGNLCYYGRRMRSRGYHLPLDQIVSIEPVKSTKPIEQKWRDAWEKVIARLEKSGLWESLIPEIRIALEMGYERMQNAYREYWDISYKQDNREDGEKAYLEKYPELAKVNDEGKTYINTTLVWHYYTLPKVKKMRFTPSGRFYREENEARLKTIQEKIDAKEKYRTSGRASYDVSFEYNPEVNRAWYSEEYKDCGNGHYYLALDSTHALFCEDD
jgi:hypothetical protein